MNSQKKKNGTCLTIGMMVLLILATGVLGTGYAQESESPEIYRYSIDDVPVTNLANVADVYELEEGGFILVGGADIEERWILKTDENGNVLSVSFMEDTPQGDPYFITAGMVHGKFMVGFHDAAYNKGYIGILNDSDGTYEYVQLNDYADSMTTTDEGVLVCGGRSTGEYTNTFWGTLIGSDGQILWEYCPDYEMEDNESISGLYCDATDDACYLFGTQPIDGYPSNLNGYLTRLDPDGTVIWEKIFQLPEYTQISGMSVNEPYILLYGRNEVTQHGVLFLFDTDGCLQQQIEVNELFAAKQAILTDTAIIVAGRDGKAIGTSSMNGYLWKFLTYDFDGALLDILPVQFTDDVFISVLYCDKDNTLWAFGRIDEDVLMMRFH